MLQIMLAISPDNQCQNLSQLQNPICVLPQFGLCDRNTILELSKTKTVINLVKRPCSLPGTSKCGAKLFASVLLFYWALEMGVLLACGEVHWWELLEANVLGVIKQNSSDIKENRFLSSDQQICHPYKINTFPSLDFCSCMCRLK